VSAINEQRKLSEHYADVCKEIFGKEDITPDERIEVETLCALGIELIKSESSYKLREAGRLVELRFRLSSKNAL